MTESIASLSDAIRVAIVEDIATLRAELCELISGTRELVLCAVASTGEEALELIPRALPHVVLMDIGLPGMSGVECVRRLKELVPETEFMMLTIFEDHESVYASLQAGATGYLVKGLASERLLEMIRELRAGGSPMSSSIARRVVQRLIAPVTTAPPETLLSLREEEVLRMLASGQRYKEIAGSLGLSVHTVRTHIHRIYKKLQARTKAEAVQKFRASERS